jgi:ATP-dependent Clp protease ATP-binding subunit ClpB
VREQVEQTKVEIAQAERQYDLNRAAELKYGKLVGLEKATGGGEREVRQAQAGPRMIKEEVDEEDIAEVVSRWTGVPVTKLLEGEMQKLLHLEDELHKRVIGQDEAVTAVAEAVMRARSGLNDPDRPVGSFIFLGPTGVGKTELARALAAFLFDDERAMIRIDMSEYQEKHTVARLVGAPPGYVGYEEGGQLTEAVRRRPYSVVLFDEIEKAHHDVFNVMLQILDDGRLTDGQGRTVDFKNTIVVMTSNVGSARILEHRGGFEGADYEAMKEAVLEEMRAHFRPEFLNRVDEIIVFHALSEAHLKQIVEIQLGRVRARLADRHITLTLTDAARGDLVRTGYDPRYGARPLKRAIQKKIETPLGKLLLQGDRQPTHERSAAKDDPAGAKLIAPELVKEDAGAETDQHFILDGQQMREHGVDPYPFGQIHIAPDPRPAPTQHPQFESVAGKHQHGGEQRSTDPDPERAGKGAVAIAKAGVAGGMARRLHEEAVRTIGRQKAPQALPRRRKVASVAHG